MARRRPDPHPGAAELYGRILHVRGYVEIPPKLYSNEWEGGQRVGSWLILKDLRQQLERKILKIASRPGGADRQLLRISDYPEGLVSSLVQNMCTENTLITRGGWFFPQGDAPLSPYHRGWLKRLEEAGEEGLRVRSVPGDSDRAALEVLNRSGLIKGGEALWFSNEASDALKSRLLRGRKKGDRISMADAREILGGSRTRTLEILSLLNSEGILSRTPDGEHRVVM
jgi:selenocysteine-specific elongation factor